MPRWVLHVDLDQFIAAVEILRRPELAGLPVVVGGTGAPEERAVVATASYEARAHGVGSGTPMRLARRRLPDAVFLPADNEAYQVASDEVMDVLRATGEPVEVIGWDEAFVGTDSDPHALAEAIRRDVAEHTRLSCAVGIGDNTLRAKTATGFGKPGGVFELTARNWFATMGGRDPESLPGIGRYVPRSRSRETTFPHDVDDAGQLRAEVTALAHRVAADVAEEDRDVARVGLKVRLAPFLTRTRSAAIDTPGRDGEEIAAAAARTLLEAMAPDRPVCLLGVRAEFVEPLGSGPATTVAVGERAPGPALQPAPGVAQQLRGRVGPPGAGLDAVTELPEQPAQSGSGEREEQDRP